MFKGTIRSNLDPFEAHSDAALWDALRKCHMSDEVRQLEGALDAAVAGNGSNFSLGQQQVRARARLGQGNGAWGWGAILHAPFTRRRHRFCSSSASPARFSTNLSCWCSTR